MASGNPTQSAKRPRILIVDDDPGQRSLLNSFLTSQDFSTMTVASGEQALAALRTEPFAMMISDVRGDHSRLDVTFHTYREVLERSRSFEAVAVTKPWRPTLTGTTQPERLDGQRVSAMYFRTLGISPALGRDFDLSDDQLNGPRVVILSDVLWKRRFAGDRTIVGHPVKLDDNLYTVIGVLPIAFENVLAPLAELWSPLQYDTRNITSLQTREWGHHLRMVGRLRSGLGSEQLRRELDTIARMLGTIRASRVLITQRSCDPRTP